jgi:fructose-bisphosphate aldolase class II
LRGAPAPRARYGAGARFDDVVHGGGGSDPADLRAAVEHGVVQMNIDGDTRHALTGAIADVPRGSAGRSLAAPGG